MQRIVKLANPTFFLSRQAFFEEQRHQQLLIMTRNFARRENVLNGLLEVEGGTHCLGCHRTD